MDIEQNKTSGTFLEGKHSFNFSIKDLFYIGLIVIPIFFILIQSYYFHEAWLNNIDRINNRQDILVEKMGVSISKLLETQNETLGTLKVVISNQQLVMNKLTSVGVYQQVYRPKNKDRATEKDE